MEKYLYAAATAGDLDEVKACLKTGRTPCVDIMTARGRTALWMAAARGHTAVCVRLIDAGANPEAGDEKGRTPLEVAARWGHERCCARLLERGCLPTARGVEYAAAEGFEDIVDRLAKAGAPVTCKALVGATGDALITCVRRAGRAALEAAFADDRTREAVVGYASGRLLERGALVDMWRCDDGREEAPEGLGGADPAALAATRALLAAGAGRGAPFPEAWRLLAPVLALAAGEDGPADADAPPESPTEAALLGDAPSVDDSRRRGRRRGPAAAPSAARKRIDGRVLGASLTAPATERSMADRCCARRWATFAPCDRGALLLDAALKAFRGSEDDDDGDTVLGGGTIVYANSEDLVEAVRCLAGPQKTAKRTGALARRTRAPPQRRFYPDEGRAIHAKTPAWTPGGAAKAGGFRANMPGAKIPAGAARIRRAPRSPRAAALPAADAARAALDILSVAEADDGAVVVRVRARAPPGDRPGCVCEFALRAAE